MTQKRFKKLIMSKGYGRNAANEIVKRTQQSGKTYAEAYSEFLLYNRINISCATEAFQNAVETLKRVAAACAKAIGAFGKAFNEAMKEGAGND